MDPSLLTLPCGTTAADKISHVPIDSFLLSAARTPIGRYGGGLKNIHPSELGAVAGRAAVERASLPPELVDLVIVGHARQAGSGPNPARQVGRRMGLGDHVPAWTLNQACASGLQAVASAAQAIAAGDAEVVVAGGIESMSRMPYLIDADDARWGHKMGHFPLVDAMYRDGFRCSLSGLIMGETVELLAREYGITREQSDHYACESQRRAEEARKAGRFAAEIAPVRVQGATGETTIAVDEHPRPGTTLEALAQLPLVFPEVDGGPGIITAGSSVVPRSSWRAPPPCVNTGCVPSPAFWDGPPWASTPRAWASAPYPPCTSSWPDSNSTSTTSISSS